MSLKNKSILITGGAGFIGSHLIEAIISQEPEKIVVVDNFFLGNVENLKKSMDSFKNLVIYREDASDYTAMENIFLREKIEVVYNLASKALPYSFIHPEGAFSTNVNIANVLASLARKDLFETLIHFSSSEVYGSAMYIPMNENHPLHPTTPYAAGKASADLLLLSNQQTFGIDLSILRPFNNYGPRQNETIYSAIIPLTIKRILRGKKPIIEGEGTQTRDFLYVSDTVNAALKVYETKSTRGKEIQVATGRETSVNEVVKTISEELGYVGGVEKKPPRPADVKRHCGSIELAKKLIGFEPIVSFREGIRKTIDYYKNIELKDFR